MDRSVIRAHDACAAEAANSIADNEAPRRSKGKFWLQDPHAL